MNTNPRLFRASDAGLGGFGYLASPIGLGLGVAQSAYGIVKGITDAAKIKNLLAQRRAFQTPDQIFQLLNATENRAQSGYDPFTLNYLTSGVDRATDASLGTAERLGANPNDLSGLLDQRIQGLMKIGAENHAQNTENFSRYINALSLVADNNAAEQKSQQDILKDKIQAVAGSKKDDTANTSVGLSNIISTLSSDKIAQLYKKLGIQQPASTPAASSYI